MSTAMGFLSAAFWGLVVLSLLVFIHEGGHFLVARLCSVRVTEFFLGLPSRHRISRKSRKYGTEFGVTPFLLGGYNRICGMEHDEDERLAAALACVQRHGRVRVSELAEELGCDEDDAYLLMATLVDWGSIKPYYDPELGEREGQRDWPQSFQTLARDGSWLTEYDRDHEFSAPGYTAEAEPRPVEGDPAELIDRERSHTYRGKGFGARLAMLLAGAAVNIAFAFLVVSLTLAIFGLDVATTDGVRHWQPDLVEAMSFTVEYGMAVARRISELLMPQHTMAVLEESSSVVGISVMASEAAAAGPIDLALLLAAVSMSLGFMNLLPIPPLDGGKIVVEVIQLVIRRPISVKAQNAISYVGLAFFLFIFVMALRNDLVRYAFVA